MNNPRRQDRYRKSRLEQMLGLEEYHRHRSLAKQCELEGREREHKR